MDDLDAALAGTSPEPVTSEPRTVLAIDPGTVWTGWAVLRDGDEVLDAGVTDDRDAFLRGVRLAGRRCWWMTGAGPEVPLGAVVIENIEPRFGQTQGWEVFDTARFVGRMQEAALPLPVTLLGRSEVLSAIGVNVRRRRGEAKVNADSAVRALLIDRWGGAAAARKGGALAGVTSHAWQALAVAVAWSEGCRGRTG